MAKEWVRDAHNKARVEANLRAEPTRSWVQQSEKTRS